MPLVQPQAVLPPEVPLSHVRRVPRELKYDSSFESSKAAVLLKGGSPHRAKVEPFTRHVIQKPEDVDGGGGEEYDEEESYAEAAIRLGWEAEYDNDDSIMPPTQTGGGGIALSLRMVTRRNTRGTRYILACSVRCPTKRQQQHHRLRSGSVAVTGTWGPILTNKRPR